MQTKIQNILCNIQEKVESSPNTWTVLKEVLLVISDHVKKNDILGE